MTTAAQTCTHRHSTKAKVREDRLAELPPPALLRATAADVWLSRAYSVVRATYRGWTRKVVERYSLDGVAEVASSELVELDAAMLATGTPLTFSMVEAGYEWSAQEFGQEAALSMPAQMAQAKANVPRVVKPWADFIQTADFSGVEAHIQAVSVSAAETQAGAINRLFVQAATANATRAEIAKTVLAEGLVVSDTRAALWARTETQWAYNEGAHQQYIANGVAVEEWVTTFDDATCEFCIELDGIKVRTSDDFLAAGAELTGSEGGTYSSKFPVGHPPVHPNCRCIIVPATAT